MGICRITYDMGISRWLNAKRRAELMSPWRGGLGREVSGPSL